VSSVVNIRISSWHRLYCHDSFLHEFDAEVREVTEGTRPALVLDRSAFYPPCERADVPSALISTKNSGAVENPST
jgi:hypothetical protein